MSAVGLLPSFRKLYRRAQLEVSRWEALQLRAEDQFTTAVNVLERLPVMQDESCFGVLRDLPGLPERILDKQLLALEALFKRLNASLLEMEEVVLSLDRLAQEASKVQLSAGGLTLEASFLRSGASPSPAECCEGLQDIWMMMRSELALKHVLVKSLTYDASEHDMEEAAACFRDQPNVDSCRIADVLYRVSSTEPIEKR